MIVSWNDKAVIDAIRPAVERSVVSGANMVKAEAIRLIKAGGKTGRRYRRRGVVHQASAPGEAPASDSGRLSQSGTVTLLPGGVSARVTFGTAYARALERGSAYSITGSGGHGGLAAQFEMGTQKLAPRPFLRPALMNKRGDIATMMIHNIGGALKGFTIRPAQGSLL